MLMLASPMNQNININYFLKDDIAWYIYIYIYYHIWLNLSHTYMVHNIFQYMHVISMCMYLYYIQEAIISSGCSLKFSYISPLSKS